MVVVKCGCIGGLGCYYIIKYKFMMLEGKMYFDEINVIKMEVYGVVDGECIKVCYYIRNFEINFVFEY